MLIGRAMCLIFEDVVLKTIVDQEQVSRLIHENVEQIMNIQHRKKER